MQQAQKDLALVNSAILEYTAVAERARKQGLIPEGELLRIAELEKRRDALTAKLQALSRSSHRRVSVQLRSSADDTSARNKAADDEEKKFFEEKKQRDAQLKART